jgi:leucyl aminopeptidase
MPTFRLSRENAADVACDVLAVPVFSGAQFGPGAREIEKALGARLQDVVDQAPLMSKAFAGDLGEVCAIPTLGKLKCKQVLLVGLGDKAGAKGDVARKAGAQLARRVGGARTVATTLTQALRGDVNETLRAFVEGFLLASYKYEAYKRKQEGKPNRVDSVAIIEPRAKGAAATKAIAYAETLAEGTNLARDLVNTPSGDKSPESLAAEARKMAGKGLKVKVWDEKELEAKGFGGILGVGRGSRKPPRLIQLRYEPAGARKTIAIVGKGITFDSGGLDLKPADGMESMKTDMGGGASVLGAMLAIAKLKPKVAVHGYIASAENMPDGNATRPGDVLKHYGGITSEVMNTDAEGRLVMADAIAYAAEHGADVIVDIATLTGACMVALGHWMFGVIGEPRAEVRKMLDAAERAGESAWELPLFKPYRKVLDSDIADLRNIANTNIGGGAITAALFLKEFAGDTPYVHLDIAGPSYSRDDSFERVKGASGAGVRTLVEYVLSQ